MKTAIFYRADSICIEVDSGFWQARCSSLAISVLRKSARLEDCVLYPRVLSQHTLLLPCSRVCPVRLFRLCTAQFRGRQPQPIFLTVMFLPARVTRLEEETPLSSVLPSSCQCLTTHRQGLRPLQLLFPPSF